VAGFEPFCSALRTISENRRYSHERVCHRQIQCLRIVFGGYHRSSPVVCVRYTRSWKVDFWHGFPFHVLDGFSWEDASVPESFAGGVLLGGDLSEGGRFFPGFPAGGSGDGSPLSAWLRNR
jgi:hypothetical protein